MGGETGRRDPNPPVVVLTGERGVGKSTVAANLAVSLAQAGKKVGLLDIDVHGPSIPGLLRLEGRQIMGSEEGMLPVMLDDNLAVMSVGFLLHREYTPVIWRGPMKYGVISQFLKDVVWGELDYLVVDSPPGTGDEPLSVVQLGALVPGDCRYDATRGCHLGRAPMRCVL